MLIQNKFSVATRGRGLVNITDQVAAFVLHANVQTGLCHLFLHHTSASIILCENADPQVLVDLEMFMNKLIPDGSSMFQHVAEGKDDMPAHVRAILTQSFQVIPISNGQLALGTWQGIFLWEHRYQGSNRRLTVTIW